MSDLDQKYFAICKTFLNWIDQSDFRGEKIDIKALNEKYIQFKN